MPRTDETLLATNNPRQDRSVYGLRGIDQSNPDQILQTRTPFERNMRMYSEKDEDEASVALRTRKGKGFFSDVVGAASRYTVTGTAGTPVAVTATSFHATPFTTTRKDRLTKVIINPASSTGAGPLIVSIHEDQSGSVGKLIGESSPLESIPSTSAPLDVQFIDAPLLEDATQYWVVVKMQDNGTGQYLIDTTTATNSSTSINSGGSWTSGAQDMVLDIHTTESTGVKGAFVSNFPLGSRKIFAAGDSIYEVNIVTGAVTTVHSGMDATATRYEFDHHDGKTYWVNGRDDFIYVWDGTTVTTITSPELNPYTIRVHENRMFVIGADDPTKMRISALLDFTTYESLGVPIIQFIPSPKSGDPVTKLVSFQGTLVCFTNETKYVLYGQDLASFSLRQTVGIKGSTAPSSIVADGNYIYFLSDDGVYRFNGADDELLSKRLSRELRNMNNRFDPCAVVWNNQYRLYYPSQPSAFNDRVAVYEIMYDDWFIDDGGSVGHVFYDKQRAGNPLYEYSDLVPQVYLAEELESDLGKPIDAKYWTSYQHFNSATQQHRIKKFYPILRAVGQAFDVRVGRARDFNFKADFRTFNVASTGSTWGGGDTWAGGAQWGGNKVKFRGLSFSGKSRYSQFRLERKGVNTPMKIYGYMVIYKTGRIR